MLGLTIRFLSKHSTKSVWTKMSYSSAINNRQIEYLNEPCIQVNICDEVIGKISKRECHQNGILHRAFSVFIFNKENKLLLQKRSPYKITFPNLWTNSCCSHPHYNELEMEQDSESTGIQRAAYRKLSHELGIMPWEIGRMHVIGRYLYSAKSDEVWSEHELDYVLIVPNFNGTIKPNQEEVSEIKFVDEVELQEMFSKDFQFTPWFQLLFSQKWLGIWWKNLNDINLYKDPMKIHKLC